MAASPDPTTLVSTMLGSMERSISSISFTSEGQFLLGGLTLIALSWMGVRHMLAHETFADTVGAFFSIALLWGFASWIIGVRHGGINFLDSLNGGFDQVAGHILGRQTFNEILGQMLHSALSLFEGDTNILDASILDTIMNTGLAAASFVMRIFSAILILVCTLLYAGQYLVTQFMIKIGTILAPILVPWVMLQPTRFLFEGWLKFMIIAGMQKVVGALMLMASANIISDANALAASAGSDASASFYVYSVVLIILGIMAFLMMQATGTAHSLVSGGVGMGTFKAPSKLTPGGATTAASGTMQKTGAAAAQGGAAGAGGLAGAIKAGGAVSAAGGSAGQSIGAAKTGFSAGARAAMSAGGGGRPTMNPVKGFKAGSTAGQHAGEKAVGEMAKPASASPTSLSASQQRASQAASAALSTGRTSLSTSSGQWRAAGGNGAPSYRAPTATTAPSGVSAGYKTAFKSAVRAQKSPGKP